MDSTLAVAALLPAIALMIYIYRKDRVEKEPVALLVSLVFFGILSTFIAMVLEEAGSLILDGFLPEDSVAYNLVFFFGVVALAEEGAKYVLLKRRTWNVPDFNCTFDAVVYAVFVSLGFALWENLGYVGMYGMSGALIRAVTAVPGHACFGVLMGVWYGRAKRSEVLGDPGKSAALRKMAVLVPALTHGLYDFLTTLTGAYSGLIFYVYVIFIFVCAFRAVKRESEQDQYISQGGWGGYF